MTATSPDMTDRERDKLYVTDAELIRRIGVPENICRQNIKTLDADPASNFPPKQPVFGNRRYWPAVAAWFDANNRLDVALADEKKPARTIITSDTVGKVYFLASQTHVKIGFSAAGVKKRAKTIRNNHYEELRILAILTDVPRSVEATLHKKFAAYRIKGKREWFALSPEIDEFIRNHGLGHWRKELMP